jgi:hypothetical protein
MSEKPRKRLVSWQQCLGIKGVKGAGYSFSIVCILGGLLFLFFGLMFAASGLSERHIEGPLEWILPGGFMSGLGIATIRGGKMLFKYTKEIPPVQLITHHNTGQLPEVETLVRASDLPTSHQQANLLRAAPQGSETPAEELLRAATTTGQDA